MKPRSQKKHAAVIRNLGIYRSMRRLSPLLTSGLLAMSLIGIRAQSEETSTEIQPRLIAQRTQAVLPPPGDVSGPSAYQQNGGDGSSATEWGNGPGSGSRQGSGFGNGAPSGNSGMGPPPGGGFGNGPPGGGFGNGPPGGGSGMGPPPGGGFGNGPPGGGSGMGPPPGGSFGNGPPGGGFGNGPPGGQGMGPAGGSQQAGSNNFRRRPRMGQGGNANSAFRREGSKPAAHQPSEKVLHALTPQEEAATFSSNVKVRITKSFIEVDSNGIPNHPTAQYPNEHNPNTIQQQDYHFKIPLKPKFAAIPTTLPFGPIGVAVNGIPFYNPYNAEGRDAVFGPFAEVFDSCCGHPDPGGRYHYHKYPVCVKSPFKDLSGQHSPLIGWAFDGFAVYGPERRTGHSTKRLRYVQWAHRLG